VPGVLAVPGGCLGCLRGLRCVGIECALR
jgi:hypothetical protein